MTPSISRRVKSASILRLHVYFVLFYNGRPRAKFDALRFLLKLLWATTFAALCLAIAGRNARRQIGHAWLIRRRHEYWFERFS